MPVAIVSRKTARKKLAELVGEIGTFVTVYDHETKDFEGQSPVGMVHSDGSRTIFSGYVRDLQRFFVTILWARDSAADTEDYLDDLGKEVRQKLFDNRDTSGYWEDLVIDQDSQQDYPVIDGVMYRRERIPVICEVKCNG